MEKNLLVLYKSMNEIFNEMKDTDIIKESYSTWAAPIILVMRKHENPILRGLLETQPIYT